jgi:hypothetical protein
VQSTKQEAWETLILHGEPHRRMLERDGKPLSPEEQRKEQQKLDRADARLNGETPAEQQRRLEDAEKRRRREFAFLSEIPELFDLRLESESVIEARKVSRTHDPGGTHSHARRPSGSNTTSIPFAPDCGDATCRPASLRKPTEVFGAHVRLPGFVNPVRAGVPVADEQERLIQPRLGGPFTRYRSGLRVLDGLRDVP